jgi:hypothetical protein
MRTICEILAADGFRVRAPTLTATARAQGENTAEYLAAQGIHPQPTRGAGRPELAFEHRGISYRLLDTAGTSWSGWQKLYGKQFDRIFDEELERFDPDIVFTFGGEPGDVRRRQRARRRGVKVVFGLRNVGYLESGALAETDGILSASRFVTDRYREAAAVESTALPSPLELEDVVAEERQPIFVTMINPTLDKGLMVFARIAEEVSVRPADGRGGAGHRRDTRRRGAGRRVRSAAAREYSGVASDWTAEGDLRRDAGAAGAVIGTRRGAAGDRGGAGERNPADRERPRGAGRGANGGGFVVAIPPEVTSATRVPVSAEIAAPWVELILRLTEDDAAYAEASRRASQAGALYRPETLGRRYVDYFNGVLVGGLPA